MYIDSINRLHLKTLKSIVGTLSLLPASYIFHYLWFYSNDSEQLMIRFFALTTFSAWAIITFIIALTHTTTEMDDEFNSSEQFIVNIYKQLPMVFFTVFLLFLQFCFC